MSKYNVEYKVNGEVVLKGKLTLEELNAFMNFMDEERIKKIQNGESTLIVQKVREENER